MRETRERERERGRVSGGGGGGGASGAGAGVGCGRAEPGREEPISVSRSFGVEWPRRSRRDAPGFQPLANQRATRVVEGCPQGAFHQAFIWIGLGADES
jgi:hypothetical protein